MTRDYLKKATLTSESDASSVHETVKTILSEIEAGGDAKALEYAAKSCKKAQPQTLRWKSSPASSRVKR